MNGFWDVLQATLPITYLRQCQIPIRITSPAINMSRNIEELFTVSSPTGGRADHRHESKQKTPHLQRRVTNSKKPCLCSWNKTSWLLLYFYVKRIKKLISTAPKADHNNQDSCQDSKAEFGAAGIIKLCRWPTREVTRMYCRWNSNLDHVEQPNRNHFKFVSQKNLS